MRDLLQSPQAVMTAHHVRLYRIQKERVGHVTAQWFVGARLKVMDGANVEGGVVRNSDAG